MFRLSLNAVKSLALVLAVQMFAAPATANSVKLGSGVFIAVGPHYSRSKHKVHRYYGAPKVHHHKSKPRVHYVKPKKKRHYPRGVHRLNHVNPHHFQKRYGIKHRTFSRYK
ncbi:MAG: hypothetical protein AB3N23_12910 [Paracoccaceae bacterium]